VTAEASAPEKTRTAGVEALWTSTLFDFLHDNFSDQFDAANGGAVGLLVRVRMEYNVCGKKDDSHWAMILNVRGLGQYLDMYLMENTLRSAIVPNYG
jgi:hypothetical protein